MHLSFLCGMIIILVIYPTVGWPTCQSEVNDGRSQGCHHVPKKHLDPCKVINDFEYRKSWTFRIYLRNENFITFDLLVVCFLQILNSNLAMTLVVKFRSSTFEFHQIRPSTRTRPFFFESDLAAMATFSVISGKHFAWHLVILISDTSTAVKIQWSPSPWTRRHFFTLAPVTTFTVPLFIRPSKSVLLLMVHKCGQVVELPAVRSPVLGFRLASIGWD